MVWKAQRAWGCYLFPRLFLSSLQGDLFALMPVLLWC
jgi:hypothetical protein